MKAPGTKKKPKEGPLRWNTVHAIVGIARLIVRAKVQLQDALQNDWPKEELPTATERITALEARNLQLWEELGGVRGEATRARNAHRKSAVRLVDAHGTAKELKFTVARQGKQLKGVVKKERTIARLSKQLKSVRDARKKSSRKAKTVSKAEAKRRMKQARAWRVRQVEVKEKAVEQSASDIAELKKKLAAAKKRARIKESTAARSVKRLKRAKVAETALKHLQATLEEEPEVEESDAEEEEGNEAGSKSRRDARGRFAPMPHALVGEIAPEIEICAISAISPSIRKIEEKNSRNSSRNSYFAQEIPPKIAISAISAISSGLVALKWEK